MSLWNKLFAKASKYQAVNPLETSLQNSLKNPDLYEAFHKNLLSSEIIVLGTTDEEGAVKLQMGQLQNFTIVFLFTSENILNKVAKKEKREYSWLALPGESFFNMLKDQQNILVQINFGMDEMNYLLQTDERKHLCTNYK